MDMLNALLTNYCRTTPGTDQLPPNAGPVILRLGLALLVMAATLARL